MFDVQMNFESKPQQQQPKEKKQCTSYTPTLLPLNEIVDKWWIDNWNWRTIAANKIHLKSTNATNTEPRTEDKNIHYIECYESISI